MVYYICNIRMIPMFAVYENAHNGNTVLRRVLFKRLLQQRVDRIFHAVQRDSTAYSIASVWVWPGRTMTMFSSALADSIQIMWRQLSSVPISPS
ncbi:MAG: hypothetical protein RL194_957 [Pseudomonadota bacterium]